MDLSVTIEKSERAEKNVVGLFVVGCRWSVVDGKVAWLNPLAGMWDFITTLDVKR